MHDITPQNPPQVCAQTVIGERIIPVKEPESESK
jgi:hypothetical protein